LVDVAAQLTGLKWLSLYISPNLDCLLMLQLIALTALEELHCYGPSRACVKKRFYSKVSTGYCWWLSQKGLHMCHKALEDWGTQGDMTSHCKL
jgi:hypothetical protein